MPEYTVHKAEPIGSQVVPSVTVAITEPLPARDDKVSLARAALLYAMDAAIVEEALHQSLPGGTYDRVLIEMLQRKASHLRVSFVGGDCNGA